MRPRGTLAVLLLAVCAAAGERPPLDAQARDMARLLNAARAKRELPPLAWDERLARVARGHCEDMRDHGFFAHESPRTGTVDDRLARAGIPRRASGENIARSTSTRQAHANLMGSPGHRKNILSEDFTHVGIGLTRHRDGRLLVTQVFIRAVPEVDVAALGEQILTAINAARKKADLRRLVPHERLAQLALEHSRHAARRGKPDPLWLEDRIAQSGMRWATRDCAFFLTDEAREVVESPTAMGRRYEYVGLGLVQSSPHSKAAGALWVTLICAQK